jgi:hypothetical protein
MAANFWMEKVICGFPCKKLQLPGLNGRGAAYGHTKTAPMVLILISIFFCATPLYFDAETLTSALPITVCTILCILIGELLIVFREKRKETLSK